MFGIRFRISRGISGHPLGTEPSDVLHSLTPMATTVSPSFPSGSWAYAHMVGVSERKSMPFGDRCEKLLPSGLKETLDCPTRDAHFLSGLLLLLPFEVAQAHCFQLVQPELDDLQLRQRNPCRLE